MQNNKKYFRAYVVLGFLLASLFTTQAQGPNKNTDIITDPSELLKLKAEVESAPGDLKKHQDYIKAVGTEIPEELEKQYQQWIKQFPNVATVPFAIGDAYCSKESPKAKPFLLKAVEIDPTLDKAYFDLWIDGERWGDFTASRSYLAKAVKVKPENADYSFYYANTFSDNDPATYQKLSLEVTKKFPGTERGAQSLYWLANRSQDTKEKVKYYELMRNGFPPDKFSWSSSGMSEYFDLLLQTSPAKALALTQSILELKIDERQIKSWTSQATIARNVIQADSSLTNGNPQAAYDILKKINVGRYSSAKTSIALLKAKAVDAMGNPQAAYDSLLVFFAKEPEDKTGEALKKYGKKIEKDEKRINEDIRAIRDAGAKPATTFTLQEYLKTNNFSLTDYRGKVVLITYWFPGCGPCRGEFPNFENVVRKFKGKDLVYVGINIALDQDDYVVPFMKSSGYSFIPLRDDPKWDKGNLSNRNAAPMNFLIDKDGRIVFSNFRTNESNERTLELMINSLLTTKAL